MSSTGCGVGDPTAATGRRPPGAPGQQSPQAEEAGLDHSQTLVGGPVPCKQAQVVAMEGSPARARALCWQGGRSLWAMGGAASFGPSSWESGTKCTETLRGSHPEAHSAARESNSS